MKSIEEKNEEKTATQEWLVEKGGAVNGDLGKEDPTFGLQRRSEVGVIVTITTGGPVAMETGRSGGWVRDKREDTCTHTHTRLGDKYIHTYIYP